jgi:hypothetical protein
MQNFFDQYDLSPDARPAGAQLTARPRSSGSPQFSSRRLGIESPPIELSPIELLSTLFERSYAPEQDVSATGIQAFQLAAMDERERKFGNKPEIVGGGGGGGYTAIYRAGDASPSNLTPRPGEKGLSFRDSKSNPYPKGARPVFPPGGKYIEVDPTRLPPGSVIPDNLPPGHVTVLPAPLEVLRNAIMGKRRFPK